MARPVTYTDLPADDRKGPQVMTIDMDKVPARGAMLTALGAFFTAVEKVGGMTVAEDKYGNVSVHRTPTEDQLELAMRAAQQDWDEQAARYDAALVSGTMPEDYTRYGIESWARREGKPLPWETGK